MQKLNTNLKKTIVIRILFFVIVCYGITSCLRDERPGWDVNVIAPIFKTELTLSNLLADSITQHNPDGTVSLVYLSKLASVAIDSSLKMPDTSNQANIKLNNLTLDPVTVSNSVSLMQLVALHPDKDMLLLAIGLGLSVPIPAFGPMMQDSILLDFGGYFQTMTITDGIVDIGIKNDFPFPFTDVIFSLRNKVNNEIIFTQTIPLIPANDSVTVSAHIGAKTIESQLYATTEISSPGSPTAIKLDPSWKITSTITLHDVQIYSAIAHFPPQTVIYDANVNVLEMDGYEFHRIVFQRGVLKIEVYNTLPSPLHYIYKIQSASFEGVSFEVTGIVPAAEGGNAYHTTHLRELKDYELDMRGIGPVERFEKKDLNGNGYYDADTVNTFYNEISASIVETTPLIPLSLNDSVYIRIEFLDMLPGYAEGFLGKDTLQFSDTVSFRSILSDLDIERLSFDSINVDLLLKNKIGCESEFKIEEITAINTLRNSKVSLSGYPIGQNILINRPSKPFAGSDDVVPAYTAVSLNSAQSNIEKLIEIIPDKFIIRSEVLINREQERPVPGTGKDFVFIGKGIDADMGISIPLSVVAEKIRLRDTSFIDASSLSIDDINNNKFQMIAENQFPLDASIQVYIADDKFAIVDSLMAFKSIINAGLLNPTTKFVDVPTKSVIKLELSKEKTDKLIHNPYLIVHVELNTSPSDQYVKIYSDYQLKVKLTGIVKQRIK